MYIEVTETMFKDEFRKADRLDNFSYQGLSALYDYLTELENETDEPMKLDVIAICCEYSEEPLDEVLENYNLESLEELQDNTLVVAVFGDVVLYQNF
jgi:hypothetical protein